MATINAFSPDLDLNLTQRCVLDVIDRGTRASHDCFMSAVRIAGKLGISRRTVELAIAALEARGLVRRVRDYTLRIRRRIKLLWREEAAGEPAGDGSLCANPADHCAQIPQPSPAAPPLVSSEEAKYPETDDDTRPGPVAPSEPAPPTVSSSSSGEGFAAPGDGEKPSAEAKAANRAKAEAVLGPGGAMKCEALAKSRAYPPAWIPRALDVVAALKAKGGVGNPFGLMVGVLRNWSNEGGPPPEAAAAPTRATRLDQAKALMAKILARREARSCPSPTGSTNS